MELLFKNFGENVKLFCRFSKIEKNMEKCGISRKIGKIAEGY